MEINFASLRIAGSASEMSPPYMCYNRCEINFYHIVVEQYVS